MPILSKEDERYGYEPGSFAFWRNLAVYFCVFSVVGHWMEIVYCSFMNVFGIVDADSLVWDDPMLMELAMGFMLNQPNAAGEYPLWDNSQLPFNILGQAWLVNDLALAAVAMLYTWIVYPLCQKALGKLPLRVMNLLAAVVVIGFVVLCAVKFA